MQSKHPQMLSETAVAFLCLQL